MQAVVYQGTGDVRLETVPDPSIEDPKDIIVKVTLSAICGSDLHLYGGLIPKTEKGDIFGHEFMGEIVEVGSEVKNHTVGDRVLMPFPISCGECWFCKNDLWSLCDTTNRTRETAEKFFGYAPAGIYGYSHVFGGYQGGQAQFVRVPNADVNAFAVPADLPDEKVLFITDIFPTGYMAAEHCNIQKGDTVAVWGAGPVGQFAVRSAFMLGAGRVIVVDSYEERLQMARGGGAETINDTNVKGLEVHEQIKEKTNGRGPDAVIDAVGMEAHGTGTLPGFMDMVDRAKQAVLPGMDRGDALREVVYSCRKGGTVSIAGAYGGMVDKFPMGAAFNKALTFKMGQTHVHRYVPLLFEKVQNGECDPSFVITHRITLDEVPDMYRKFQKKEDGCIKAVIRPNSD